MGENSINEVFRSIVWLFVELRASVCALYAAYCVSMNVQRHKNLRNQKERNFQKNKDGGGSSISDGNNNCMATKYTTMPNKNRMYEEIQRQTTIETSQLKQIWVYQRQQQ